MRQREKVARTKKFALVAYAAIFLAIAYFTMSSIVGLFLASANNKYETIQLIHQLLTIIINSKYSPSIELWELIEPLPFGTGDPLSFLKALAPPLIIFIVSSLIIGSYRTAKKELANMQAAIAREKELDQMRREEGLETVSDTSTIDIVVSNPPAKQPSWVDTWWGRIFIGVAIILVVSILGLNK